MTRHGRNQTASAVYSYQEKKKDSGELSVAINSPLLSMIKFDYFSVTGLNILRILVHHIPVYHYLCMYNYHHYLCINSIAMRTTLLGTGGCI